ncbi:MAG: hypothetical protein OEQ53_06675 [Saprospiraceae bacterium]|nr:hypothetical protein [Saprospiraceae bacterium]
MGKLFQLSLLTLLLCVACTKEETVTKFDVNIPPAVQPYIDLFLSEAAARDRAIDLSDFGLDITFQQDLEGDLAAYCSQGEIVISQQSWDARSDNKREAMIFHELGHCILHREHLNAFLPNDEWFSIMRGDPLPAGRTSSINYSGVRRQYYIDELFNTRTPEPSWVHLREEYALPEGSRDTVLHRSNSGGFTHSLSLPDSGDFEIEVLIDIQNSSTDVGLAWGGDQIQDEIVVHYNADKTFVINAGLADQSIIFQRDDFALLEDTINLISMRKRNDKYYIFVNHKFVYWMDVKIPYVNRFRVLSTFTGPANFKEILVYTLLPN